MSKVLRKLSLIPVLALVAAASLSAPRTAAANVPMSCNVYYEACPEGTYDCCCGTFQACLTSYNAEYQCQRACGIVS